MIPESNPETLTHLARKLFIFVPGKNRAALLLASESLSRLDNYNESVKKLRNSLAAFVDLSRGYPASSANWEAAFSGAVAEAEKLLTRK